MSSSVQCGQAALLGLPIVKDSKKNNNKERKLTLSNVTLPSNLRVDRKRLKADETTGIEVYKISKVRKKRRDYSKGHVYGNISQCLFPSWSP